MLKREVYGADKLDTASEKERLRQLLARHRQCGIRLRRRPLPSRRGSKGAVPLRGRARMNNIGEVTEEETDKHGPL
jgi:hypothetical protein